MLDFLDLPERTLKPRKHGLTCLTDTYLTLNDAENMVEDFAGYVDVIKLGVGSAYVTPRLKEKVALYKAANFDVYFGGTLTEKAIYQSKFDTYLDALEELGVTSIEVSSGSLPISIDELLKYVETAKKRNLKVFCEVGSKDTEKISPPSEWVSQIKAYLEAGAAYVITEGRDSGTAGIFRTSGELRSGLIEDIVREVSPERLIFEAPTTKSQMGFINRFGANVNLGNIRPSDVLILEAQRQALRYETFFLPSDKQPT